MLQESSKAKLEISNVDNVIGTGSASPRSTSIWRCWETLQARSRFITGKALPHIAGILSPSSPRPRGTASEAAYHEQDGAVARVWAVPQLTTGPETKVHLRHSLYCTSRQPEPCYLCSSRCSEPSREDPKLSHLPSVRYHQCPCKGRGESWRHCWALGSKHAWQNRGIWVPPEGTGRIVQELGPCSETRMQQAFKFEVLLWKALAALLREGLHMLRVDFC